MASKSLNSNFTDAKKAKEDEFYTQLADIERELKHYRSNFKDKVVYCNCDDPRVSNFFHYFSYSFERLGLKKLITTCYKSQAADLFSRNNCDHAVYLEYAGDKNQNMVPDPNEVGIKVLDGDGDFRSAEAIELLKQADIVVTNPPFSLFREYVTQLNKYDKKFVIVGNQNAISYKEVFRPIKDNKMWLGYNNGDMRFRVPNDYAPRATRFWVDDEGRKWRSLPPRTGAALTGAQAYKPHRSAPQAGDMGALEPLYCYAVSSKRYVEFNLAANGAPVIRKGSAHGLGHLLPPYPDPDRGSRMKAMSVEKWQEDLWLAIIRSAMDGDGVKLALDYHPGMNSPAASRYAATTPALLDWFRTYNDSRPESEKVRPFNFLLAFHSLKLEQLVAYAIQLLSVLFRHPEWMDRSIH